MCPKPDGGDTITANITTAQALAAYRDELRALNFNEGTVDSLVREAAHETVRNRGLGIKDPEPVSAEYADGNGFIISEDRKVINYLGENYLAYDDWNAAKLTGYETPSVAEIINTAIQMWGDLMVSGFKPNDGGPATVG